MTGFAFNRCVRFGAIALIPALISLSGTTGSAQGLDNLLGSVGKSIEGIFGGKNEKPSAPNEIQSPKREQPTPSYNAPRHDLQQNLNKDKAAVREAQRMLGLLGLSPGPADGLYGGKTRTAIQSFQRVRGTPARGDVTLELLAQLRQSAGAPPATSAAAKNSGASVSSQDVKGAQNKDRLMGGAGGAVLGAGVGALIGDKKGAVIGGLVGAGVGTAVGNEVANRRGGYAKEYNELDQAISDARQKNIEVEGGLARIETRVRDRQESLDGVTASTQMASSENARQESLLADVEADLKSNQDLLVDLKVQEKVLGREIDAVNAMIKDRPTESALIERRDALLEQEIVLKATYRQLLNVRPKLTAQKAQVSKATN